jgi:hypothetical protein
MCSCAECDALRVENARLVEELATAGRTEIKLVQRLNAAETRVGEVRTKNAAQAEQIKRLREAIANFLNPIVISCQYDLEEALKEASK